MPVALIVQLITTLGPGAVSLVEMLIQKWETQGAVTLGEWRAAKVVTQQTALFHAQAAIVAAGIDPTSDKAKQLLALVS